MILPQCYQRDDGMRQAKLFPKPQEAKTTERYGEKMRKPTVLLEIDPHLLGTPFVPSFIHQSVFMAQRLEEQFGGISLKLTGLDSVNIIAEFRWQGYTVIKMRLLASKNAPEQIVVSCPSRIIKPSLFCNWQAIEDILDLAFLDVIDLKLAQLNKYKINTENRRLTRPS